MSISTEEEQLNVEIEAELNDDVAEDIELDDDIDGEGEGEGEGEGDDLNPDILEAIASGNGSPMIPKARFDEATGALKDELRELTAKVAELEAQRQAEAATVGEPKDFAAKRAELREQYHDGTLDEEEYMDAREALMLEEAEFRAQSRVAAIQAEAKQAAAQNAWLDKFNGWASANADFMGNSIRSAMAVDLINRLSQDASLTDEQIFEQAEKELFEAFNWKNGEPAAPVNPHAQRNQRDATAQALAASAQRVAEGGMGERGRNAEIDMKSLDYNQWKRLSPEKQAELLGE